MSQITRQIRNLPVMMRVAIFCPADTGDKYPLTPVTLAEGSFVDVDKLADTCMKGLCKQIALYAKLWKDFKRVHLIVHFGPNHHVVVDEQLLEENPSSFYNFVKRHTTAYFKPSA